MSTLFRACFAGEIRKIRAFNIGDKPCTEVALMKKNYAKKDTPEDQITYTWLNVKILSPPDWMAPMLKEGSFISGSGDMSLNSYPNKQGEKAYTLECRCSSFDVCFPSEKQTGSAPKKVTPVRQEESEAPF